MKKLLLIAGIIASVAAANAASYGFTRIGGNGAVDIAGQLQMDVLPAGNQVLFVFQNLGPATSSITDIYWDDGNAAGNLGVNFSSLGLLLEPTGVDYGIGAAPLNLLNRFNISPYFNVSLNLSADSEPPVWLNGINPGEALGALLNLRTGVTYGDVLGDLRSGDLRVGLGVMLEGERSQKYDTFVNRVPDASTTAMLLGAALLGLAGLRRRLSL